MTLPSQPREGDDRFPVSVELTGREVQAIYWAVPFIRGIEEDFGEQAGTREGEAMSDVLAGVAARADRAAGRA